MKIHEKEPVTPTLKEHTATSKFQYPTFPEELDTHTHATSLYAVISVYEHIFTCAHAEKLKSPIAKSFGFTEIVQYRLVAVRKEHAVKEACQVT